MVLLARLESGVGAEPTSLWVWEEEQRKPVPAAGSFPVLL